MWFPRMSIMGMYNVDNTLFDNLVVPDGVDAQTAVQSILSECWAFNPLLPDPNIMKTQIGLWSKRKEYEWYTLYRSTMFEYNPIENYDRHEEWTDNNTGTDTLDKNSDTNTEYTQNAGTTSTPETTSTTTESGYAFDSNSFRNTKKSVTQTGGVDSSEEHSSGTDKMKSVGKDVRTLNTQNKKIGHTHGNIGVMSSQQMITQEREVAMFSIYDIIVADFKKEFCIMTYYF